jgi:hypothetical protein
VARMVELGYFPQELQGEYANEFLMRERERVHICALLHQCEWREYSKFLYLQSMQYWRNHIKGCETGVCMAMQPCPWMTTFLIDKLVDHFVACVQKMGGNILVEN